MPEVLHYRGDHRRFDPDHILGPDRDRRRMIIRTVDYDPEIGVSTAVLRAVLPAEYRERIQAMIGQAQARDRLRGLFE